MMSTADVSPVVSGGGVNTVPRLPAKQGSGPHLFSNNTELCSSATRAVCSAVQRSRGYFRHMVASICVTVGEIIMIFRLYMGSFSMGLLCR